MHPLPAGQHVAGGQAVVRAKHVNHDRTAHVQRLEDAHNEVLVGRVQGHLRIDEALVD